LYYRGGGQLYHLGASQLNMINNTPKTTTPKSKKGLLWGLIGFTVILVVTAVVLFFKLNQPAAPTPSVKPKASVSPVIPPVQQATTGAICELTFTVAASPSPSPSPSPSASPSPSPSPNACFDTCNSDAECEEDLRCQSVSGTKRCVNPTCPEDADCVCASTSPSPSPSASVSPSPRASVTPSVSPSAQQQLPQAGVNGPMVLGVSAGVLMMLAGLLWL
jgi:hypothetical protein